MRPRFHPRLYPWGPYTSASAPMPWLREPVDLDGLLVVELGEVADVPHRRDQQVARRVREPVQEDERAPSPVHDEPFLVGALVREAEDAALLLVGAADVLESPRGPQRTCHDAASIRTRPPTEQVALRP